MEKLLSWLEKNIPPANTQETGGCIHLVYSHSLTMTDGWMKIVRPSDLRDHDLLSARAASMPTFCNTVKPVYNGYPWEMAR